MSLSPIFATGTSQQAYQYQWRKNGVDLTGETSASLVIEAAAAADAGTFAVAVSNAGGTSVASGQLTVRPPGPIVFTTEPRTQTVQVGQATIFTFVATGSFPRSYQWRKDGAAITGATQATLVLSPVATGDAAAYTVAVTNPLGTTVSAAATLTVNAATPILILNPSQTEVTITHGASGSLSFSIVAGSSPISFQWYKDGVAVAAETGQSLVFSSAKPSDAGKYYVVATNPAGSATSREITLTIRAATAIAFASQPTPQSVFQGQSATFFVNLGAGSAPISYQWLKDSAPISGATNTSLRLDNLKFTDAGSYALVATNAAGSLTSNTAALTVLPAEPPSITRQPTGVAIDYFEPFGLSAEVRGTPPLTLEWRRGSSQVVGGQSSYSVNNATAEHAGDYTLVVTNVAGSVTSQVAKVVVAPPALPVITKELQSIQVAVGMSAGFFINYTTKGTGFVSVQWLKNGRPIPGADSGSQSGFRNNYLFSSVSNADEADYAVLLTCAAGTVTSKAARLTVLSAVPPTIDLWPRDISSSVGNGIEQFNVRITGGSAPISIQWHKDGIPLPGETRETLYFSPIKDADFGSYSVTVSNSAGVLASPDFALRRYPVQSLPWLAAGQLGSTVYFLATSPSRIERHDLAGGRWLPTVSLTNATAPTALLATVEGVYLAYGRTLVRRSLDLTVETPITNAPYNIVSFFTTDRLLYYTTQNPTGGSGSATVSLDRTTFAAGPSTDVLVESAVFVPARRQVYGLSYSGTSARLFPVDAQGRMGTPTYHYALERFPTGAGAFLFPSGDLVANGAGSIFRLSDMTYIGSLGERPDDFGFLPDSTVVVLRDHTLQSLNAASYFERGASSLPFRGMRLFVSGSDIFVFGAPAATGGTEFQVVKVPAASLLAPARETPVISASDRYSVDDAFLGDDGVVHVLSRSRRAVVRWSATGRAFLAPIPLRGAPVLATQTFPSKRVILGYRDGVVTQLPLARATAPETQINTVGNQLYAITDLGSLVMADVAPSSYPTRTLRYAIDDNGKVISYLASDQTDYGVGLGWDPTRRRFYRGFLSRTTEGEFTFETLLSTGAVSGASGRAVNVMAPVRFNPEAGLVLSGNGRILNADLTPAGVLANDVIDAAWLPSGLFTLRSQGGQSEVQRWSRSSYLQAGAVAVSGIPVRIFRLSDTQVVVVSNVAGTPVFTLLNDDLAIVYALPTVTAPNVAGVYLARVGTGFGFGPKELALYVRPDRTAVLIAAYEGGGGYLATNVTINTDGTFIATVTDPLNQLITDGVSGTITTDGTFTGTITSSSGKFAGTKSTGSSPHAGYYAMPATGGNVGGTYLIVGGDGRAVVIARNSTSAGGGLAAVDAQGRIVISVSGESSLVVSLESAGGAGTAQADRGPFAGMVFAGLRDDVPRTDRLANISTRGRAGAGTEALIAGFVLSGVTPRPILIRAVGPTLGAFGVPGVLADPRLEVFRGATKIVENDNWSSISTSADVVSATNRVGGFPLANGSADAVVLATLESGSYTVQVSGPEGGASGAALVEVYDASPPATTPVPGDSRLVNIATRGRIGAAGDTLIAGIVVSGNAPKRLLIRAVGPGLAAFGVPDALADPRLFLMGTGAAGATTLSSNDDWGSPSTGAPLGNEIATAALSVAAFALPSGSKDACLLLTLQPGAYTAQVVGSNNTTGVVLVEVYEISP